MSTGAVTMWCKQCCYLGTAKGSKEEDLVDIMVGFLEEVMSEPRTDKSQLREKWGSGHCRRADETVC